MREEAFDRDAAVAYARAWALRRHPAYYNFDPVGGDCTNFASQCLYAGAPAMNTTPVTGWYYRSSSDRTASWTGVEFLYRFLVNNRGLGPYGREASIDEAEAGDILQFGRESGRFYHSPVVTKAEHGRLLLAAHSADALDRPLTDYAFERLRVIHIEGFRRP